MKHTLVALFLILFNSNCFSQSYKIKLNIIDANNNITLSNPIINLSNNFYTTSDYSGKFILSNLPEGNYLLKVTHIGYKSFIERLNLISDTTIIIKLYPEAIKLGEIIVISGRYEKDLNLIPYPISVIESADIQKNPAQTVSDLLKTESGISLLRDGIWGTEISIRGLNRSNIVTLIDGNRIETSTDISARLSMFDLNDIERIEVIKGPISSLYGSGATGGIINIISKTGSYNDNFTINGNYYGGFNLVNNFFSNGLNLFASHKSWFTKISGVYRKAGNTKTPGGELSNSQFKDFNISTLFNYKPFANQEIKLNYQKFKAFDVGIPGAIPLFPNNAIVTYPQEERQLYSVEYKINNISNSIVKLSAKYFHQFISRDVENIPGIVQFVPAANGQPPKRVSVLKISPGADHNVDGFQTQADFSFTRHYLVAGFDFWKRNYTGLRTREQKIEILNAADSSVVNTIFKTTYEKPLPDANFYSAGLYAQDEYKLSNKINITLSGRYDFIWLNNSETLNPLYEINNGVINYNPIGQKILWRSQSAENKSYTFNIGLLYSLNDISNIAFNIAKSFRSPSLEERYQYIDLGSLIRVGDPNLKPEQGYCFDLGYRFFTDNLNFSSSIFFNSFTDLVTEEPGIYSGQNALIKVNIGKAILYGFEYSLSYNFSSNINFYNTISYVSGINQNDNSSLPQIPPLNGIFGIKFIPCNLFSCDLSALIFDVQNKVAKGEKTTPGYAYFNFSINISNIKSEMFQANINVGVENLFNKEYRNHLSTNRGLIIWEPGRNLFTRINFAF